MFAKHLASEVLKPTCFLLLKIINQVIKSFLLACQPKQDLLWNLKDV